MFTPGSRGCVYKTVSGRHEWPNRDASGTPLLLLPQAVALAACRPVHRLLFFPLLDHGLSLLRLEVAHAFVRAVDHGQFTAGDVIVKGS